MMRNASQQEPVANRSWHRHPTRADLAVALLATAGGLLMLLALPLLILPSFEEINRELSTGTPVSTILDPLAFLLLAIPVNGMAGGMSLALAREAFRSRLENGFGLLILALAAFVSVSLLYAGLFGTLAGILLLIAAILVEQS